MKTKLLKRTIAIILLITLMMFQISDLTNYVVKAVYEELEAQETKIENTNVTFDVFYAGEKTHSVLICYHL